MHRLSRLHGGVQGGEPGPAGRQPHVGEVHREGDVPGHPALLHGAALQPLRQRALRDDLPDGGALPPADGIVDFDGDALHRLQVVHAGLPLRRALHRPRDADGGQVPLLRASRGGRGSSRPASIVCPVQAIVSGDLDDPGSTDRAARGLPADAGAQAGAGDAAEALLPGRGRGRAHPGHAGAARTATCSPRRGDIPVPGRPNRPADARAPAPDRPRATEWISCALARTVYDVAHPERPWGVEGRPRTSGRSRSPRARSWSPRSASAPAAGRGTRWPALVAPVIALVFLLLTTAAPRARPQAARALPLPALQAEPALVAGAGRLHPDRVRRVLRRAVAARRARPAISAALHLLAWPMVVAGRGRGGLQRVSLRAGRGPRLLAEPAAAAAPARGRARRRAAASLLLAARALGSALGRRGRPAGSCSAASLLAERARADGAELFGCARAPRTRARAARLLDARGARARRSGAAWWSRASCCRCVLLAERRRCRSAPSWPRCWRWPASGSGRSSGSAPASAPAQLGPDARTGRNMSRCKT